MFTCGLCGDKNSGNFKLSPRKQSSRVILASVSLFKGITTLPDSRKYIFYDKRTRTCTKHWNHACVFLGERFKFSSDPIASCEIDERLVENLNNSISESISEQFPISGEDYRAFFWKNSDIPGNSAVPPIPQTNPPAMILSFESLHSVDVLPMPPKSEHIRKRKQTFESEPHPTPSVLPLVSSSVGACFHPECKCCAYFTTSDGNHSKSEKMEEDKSPDFDPFRDSEESVAVGPHESEKIDNLEKYFMVKGSKIVSLFEKCLECNQNLPPGKVQLSAEGTAPIIRQYCFCGSKPNIWFGQDRLFEGSMRFEGNVKLISSAFTCGIGYNALNRLFLHSNSSLFTASTYYKVTRYGRAAVDLVFDSEQRNWLQKVEKAYENSDGQGICVAADGAYDSPGYSAVIGKTVLVEQKTGLILNVHTMHYQDEGIDGKSGRMEVKGLEFLINWCQNDANFKIKQVTTDRNASFQKLCRDTFNISHKYDGWHLVKSFGNKVRQASKYKDCEILCNNIDRLKRMLWYSIEEGNKEDDGDLIRHRFNTVLNHCAGEHEWDENLALYGRITKCAHSDDIDDHNLIPKGSKAFDHLRKIVLAPFFQRDIKKADISGTSKCEVKNSIDLMYAPKHTFFSLESHSCRAKMSAMHLNTLTLAELAGARRVEHSYQVSLKFLNRKTTKSVKTKVFHGWRTRIYNQIVLFMKYKAFGNPGMEEEEEEEENELEDFGNDPLDSCGASTDSEETEDEGEEEE